MEKKMRRALKYTLGSLILFVVYLFLGVWLSYNKQPDISQEYQSSFRAADCYADTVSIDRACIIEDNEEALRERLKMMEQAEDRIILSTFEFRADESGKRMMAVLLQAAKRGVKVRILVDGMPALLRMDRNEYFYALAYMNHVEIKVYNRINVLMPWKSMGRMHDKYVIVDDDCYLLGGRNTYDYFLGDHGYKNYDRDVLVYSTDPEDERSSIHQLEQYFESVWNAQDCSPFYEGGGNEKMGEAKIELEELYEEMKREVPELSQPADYMSMTCETNRITLLSNPIHVYAKEPVVFYSLIEIMKHAEGEIFIHTPYVICNDWMYASLQEVCDKNPATSLLTNSAANNGNPFGASDYLMNKGRLVDTGLNIYEYEGGVSYHGKSISVGNRLSIIGSFNMDMRSAYLDTELMLVIDSVRVNQQLREHMQEYEAASAKVVDKEQYEIPEGVRRQEISGKDKWVIGVLKLFHWLRFLM